MKTITLDPNIIGQKFYTIANNRIMAEKVTKVTFDYEEDSKFWYYHIPIIHVKRVDGIETKVRLKWSLTNPCYVIDREDGCYKRHPLYLTPDDATTMKSATFQLLNLIEMVEESGLGWVNWEENLTDEQKNYPPQWGNIHTQPLSRYMWNGACPVETYRWLFITEINKNGINVGISDPCGRRPYLVIHSYDEACTEVWRSKPKEAAQYWEIKDATKIETWLAKTYPTKVECSNANKIEVVDFDD